MEPNWAPISDPTDWQLVYTRTLYAYAPVVSTVVFAANNFWFVDLLTNLVMYSSNGTVWNSMSLPVDGCAEAPTCLEVVNSGLKIFFLVKLNEVFYN